MSFFAASLKISSADAHDDDDTDDSDQALADYHIGFILDGEQTYRCV